MLTFEHQSLIDALPTRVFAFHERPEALRLLIPPSQPARMLEATGGIRAGARVVIGLPFGLKWVAVHTEYEQDHLFVDIQQSGPMRFWEHRHIVEAAGPGRTLLKDSVRFSLPGGAIVDLLFGWFAKLQLRSMFRYRHAVTKRECEREDTSAR